MSAAEMSKIQLWFFRELSEAQRSSLYRLFGSSDGEFCTQMGEQKILNKIIKGEVR